MRKAIICGYYGQGNAGDEALLLAILSRLNNNITPIILSGNPQKTNQDYGVISYSRLQIIKEILKLTKKDLFIWGGGSLIQDITSVKSAIYYLTLMVLAQLKGVKTIAYAQGIGPIKTPLIQWLTKIVLKRCDRISVRDQKSAKLLDKWGIKCLIAPDPVWALPSKITKKIELLPAPRIAINLRSHSSLTITKIETISQVLIKIKEKINANIILIPFQISKDLEVCEKIAQQLKTNYQILTLENAQELKGLFSQIDMLIGMRLHSLIMAGSENCKCFALSYDPKVSNLMREINIKGYDLEKLPTNIDEIVQECLNTYNNPNPISPHQIQKLAEDALKHHQLIDSVIT
ncbi:polysaccharide pyruvyl transferase CsaB [Cyanobacterium aponinum]|uniref:Polysaccharide pyruvyl transferase CsaB n=1 Tax=Cyanobacterium aponinum 0216 TaxID=2676140 RepID=A0A844GSV0_9CHRO|nr:polysaccharide pyruvyl transferase CsaB [Cyanobacterium aponinum]MTF39584.1 polysaccharide pyruvyl transferase CsaB [Cyanobacterium aponinum 0216]